MATKGTDEATPEKRRIKDLGLLEGRVQNTHFLHPVDPEPGSDELEGPHAGRNRKKKKHRRLHAVEVQAKQLHQSGGLTRDGKLDVGGLLKLAEAQEERDAAPGGVVQQKHWTMEELDIAFPDHEGNKRLGLVSDDDIASNRLPRARYERSSHLVRMRAPGTVAGLMPDDVLDYRHEKQNTTLLVMGSMGHVYSITVQPRFSVGTLKELVWGFERKHRDKAKDAKDGFKVHRQRLILERGISTPTPANSDAQPSGRAGVAGYRRASGLQESYTLGPDIRLLSWYNITDYDVVMVLPPSVEPTQDEEAAFKEMCFNAAYEREINKRLAETEDSDDNDPDYRLVKKAYLDACETSFRNCFLSNPHYRSGYEELLQKDPNFGLRVHPRLDREAVERLDKECDELMDPGFLESMWREVQREESAEPSAQGDLGEMLRGQLAAIAAITPAPLSAECIKDMAAQFCDRFELYLPLLPVSAQPLMRRAMEAAGAPEPAVTSSTLSTAEAGLCGGGSSTSAVNAEGEEIEVGSVAAAGRPPWMGKELGVQAFKADGSPFEFDVDAEYADEFRACKEAMVQERIKKVQERVKALDASRGLRKVSDGRGRNETPHDSLGANPWVDMD